MTFWRTILLLSLILPVIGGCRSVPARVQDQADHWPSDRKLESEYSHPSPSPIPTDELKLVGLELPMPTAASIPVVEEAARPKAFSLADLEGIAFQNNPTLAAASARIQVARGRQVQAGRYPNPIIGYHGTEIGNRGTSGQQGGFLSQRFITGGKLELDQAIAGKEIDEAHFHLRAQEQRVLSDVRIRFFEALIAQRRVELTKELVRIGDDLLDATETLLEGEQATENELLQAEIRAENVRILFDNATNESVEAWRRLVVVLGVPNMEFQRLSWEADTPVCDCEWEACYEDLLASHPEVNAARARVQRAQIAVARAKREPIPNVDVSVSVRHIDLTASDVANVQVGVPIPIFDKNEGNIRSAEAEWIAATKNVQRVTLGLQDQFAVVFRRYANARQQVDRYRQKILPKAERSLELVTRGYEQGQVEYLTLLLAQQTFFEVSLSHLDALRELQVASATLEGKLLTDSLDASEPIR